MAEQKPQRPKMITFGCRLNIYETELMRKAATQAGFGDAVIVNSCAVTEQAVRQARQSIRRTRRENQDAKIIVTGCAAQTYKDMFAEMDEVDFVIGNHAKLKTETYQRLKLDAPKAPRIQVEDIMQVRDVASHLVEGFGDRARAFVQVQNGCDHRCTFCIIPFSRGPSRSVPVSAAVAQIQTLCENGYKEVVLTGVDMTSYGTDLPGTPSLGQLVQDILKHVPDLPRLRLSSLDCIEIDEALFDAFGTQDRLMPHLHLSLQAGDDMTLKRMKRRHLRDDVIKMCAHMKRARPDIVFGADIIAGFPTETDEMFNNSLALVKECNLTHLHVFPYSPRPDTPAAKMPQVNGNVIKQRAAQLRTLGASQFEAHCQSLVGTEQSVLIENNKISRTPGFVPVTGLQGTPGEVVVARIDGINDRGVIACTKQEGRVHV